MTADERGLLAAVCESPDDNTPRLILADWYEENGQPDRAGFIRTQIELAWLVANEEYDTREYLNASRAVSDLPNEAFVRWAHAAGLPFRTDRPTLDLRAEAVLIRDGLYGYTFRRGFVERAELPLKRVRAVLPYLQDTTVGELTLQYLGFVYRIALTTGPADEGWRATGSISFRQMGEPAPPNPGDELLVPTRTELLTELPGYLFRYWRVWSAGYGRRLARSYGRDVVEAIDAALNPYPLAPRDAP